MINYAVLHFCPSPKKHVYMHDELLLCSWRLTMSEEGALSVRVLKTFCEEEQLVEKSVPSSPKYKNKWALSVFGEWQFARTIKVPVLDPGGLFKDYDLHKVATVSTGIEEMDALSLNYWLSKFVMEVAKKTGERYPAKTIYGIVCGIRRHLEEKNGAEALNPLDNSDRRFTLFRRALDAEEKDLSCLTSSDAQDVADDSTLTLEASPVRAEKTTAHATTPSQAMGEPTTEL
ncbi:uncharacterized protein [Montipora capricornis]|uniref:uncharacterized protein n=1 Tax=Montipora capricornis TaxID=246305 RepID=UPI0035F1F6AE